MRTKHQNKRFAFGYAQTITINLAAPISEARGLMHEHAVRRLPVVITTGQLCGVITQGDIRGADMLRAIENKIGSLPVVDDDRCVIGIITEIDLVGALEQQLDHAVESAAGRM
jgi:acetoin utilization protein AcuB/CBS domain-containing protein